MSQTPKAPTGQEIYLFPTVLAVPPDDAVSVQGGAEPDFPEPADTNRSVVAPSLLGSVSPIELARFTSSGVVAIDKVSFQRTLVASVQQALTGTGVTIDTLLRLVNVSKGFGKTSVPRFGVNEIYPTADLHEKRGYRTSFQKWPSSTPSEFLIPLPSDTLTDADSVDHGFGDPGTWKACGEPAFVVGPDGALKAFCLYWNGSEYSIYSFTYHQKYGATGGLDWATSARVSPWEMDTKLEDIEGVALVGDLSSAVLTSPEIYFEGPRITACRHGNDIYIVLTDAVDANATARFWVFMWRIANGETTGVISYLAGPFTTALASGVSGYINGGLSLASINGELVLALSIHRSDKFAENIPREVAIARSSDGSDWSVSDDAAKYDLSSLVSFRTTTPNTDDLKFIKMVFPKSSLARPTDIGFALTAQGRVFISLDAGSSWVQLTEACVAPDPSDTPPSVTMVQTTDFYRDMDAAVRTDSLSGTAVYALYICGKAGTVIEGRVAVVITDVGGGDFTYAVDTSAVMETETPANTLLPASTHFRLLASKELASGQYEDRQKLGGNDLLRIALAQATVGTNYQCNWDLWVISQSDIFSTSAYFDVTPGQETANQDQDSGFWISGTSAGDQGEWKYGMSLADALSAGSISESYKILLSSIGVLNVNFDNTTKFTRTHQILIGGAPSGSRPASPSVTPTIKVPRFYHIEKAGDPANCKAYYADVPANTSPNGVLDLCVIPNDPDRTFAYAITAHDVIKWTRPGDGTTTPATVLNPPVFESVTKQTPGDEPHMRVIADLVDSTNPSSLHKVTILAMDGIRRTVDMPRMNSGSPITAVTWIATVFPKTIGRLVSRLIPTGPFSATILPPGDVYENEDGEIILALNDKGTFESSVLSAYRIYPHLLTLSDGQTLLLACQNLTRGGVEILRSTDSGRTWDGTTIDVEAASIAASAVKTDSDEDETPPYPFATVVPRPSLVESIVGDVYCILGNTGLASPDGGLTWYVPTDSRLLLHLGGLTADANGYDQGVDVSALNAGRVAIAYGGGRIFSAARATASGTYQYRFMVWTSREVTDYDTADSQYMPLFLRTAYYVGLGDIRAVFDGEPEIGDSWTIGKRYRFGARNLMVESPTIHYRSNNDDVQVTAYWDRAADYVTAQVGDGNLWNCSAFALLGTNMRQAIVRFVSGPNNEYTEFTLSADVESGMIASGENATGNSILSDNGKRWIPNHYAPSTRKYYVWISGTNRVAPIVGNTYNTLMLGGYGSGEPALLQGADLDKQYVVFGDRMVAWDGGIRTTLLGDLVNVPELVNTPYEFGRYVVFVIPPQPTSDGYFKVGTPMFGVHIPRDFPTQQGVKGRVPISAGMRWQAVPTTIEQKGITGVSTVEHFGRAMKRWTMGYEAVKEWDRDLTLARLLPQMRRAFCIVFDSDDKQTLELVRLEDPPEYQSGTLDNWSYPLTLVEVV